MAICGKCYGSGRDYAAAMLLPDEQAMAVLWKQAPYPPCQECQGLREHPEYGTIRDKSEYGTRSNTVSAEAVAPRKRGPVERRPLGNWQRRKGAKGAKGSAAT